MWSSPLLLSERLPLTNCMFPFLCLSQVGVDNGPGRQPVRLHGAILDKHGHKHPIVSQPDTLLQRTRLPWNFGEFHRRAIAHVRRPCDRVEDGWRGKLREFERDCNG